MSEMTLLETPEGLQVLLPQLKRPFSLSFSGELDRRARQGGELIWRATGAARPNPPSILDATSGLCRDAYLLASGGAQVVALEREPLLYTLASDALTRAPDEVRARLDLRPWDALELLQSLKLGPHDFTPPLATSLPFGVIYLDPMFPARQKNASVSREAQVLQALTHLRDRPELERLAEEGALLRRSLEVAYYRVVVKRPLKAPPLPGPAPTSSIKGRAIRYDIYGIRSLQTPHPSDA